MKYATLQSNHVQFLETKPRANTLESIHSCEDVSLFLHKKISKSKLPQNHKLVGPFPHNSNYIFVSCYMANDKKNQNVWTLNLPTDETIELTGTAIVFMTKTTSFETMLKDTCQMSNVDFLSAFQTNVVVTKDEKKIAEDTEISTEKPENTIENKNLKKSTKKTNNSSSKQTTDDEDSKLKKTKKNTKKKQNTVQKEENCDSDIDISHENVDEIDEIDENELDKATDDFTKVIPKKQNKKKKSVSFSRNSDDEDEDEDEEEQNEGNETDEENDDEVCAENENENEPDDNDLEDVESDMEDELEFINNEKPETPKAVIPDDLDVIIETNNALQYEAYDYDAPFVPEKYSNDGY